MLFLRKLAEKRKGAKKIVCAFLLFANLVPARDLFAQAGEYELKAAFLYNFTQFVRWPDSSFSAPDSPFQLCIVGEDPFGKTLDDLVTTEYVDNHPIVVRRIRDVENTSLCHMAFVSAKTSIPFESVLETIGDRPVLVVGDLPDIAEKGGTIAFRVVNNRIRVEVNLASARTANLRISSKLLRLSTIIEN